MNLKSSSSGNQRRSEKVRNAIVGKTHARAVTPEA